VFSFIRSAVAVPELSKWGWGGKDTANHKHIKHYFNHIMTWN